MSLLTNSIPFIKSIPRKRYLEVIATLTGLVVVMIFSTQATPYQSKTEVLYYEAASNEASFLRAQIESIKEEKISVTILDGPMEGQKKSIDYSTNYYPNKYSPGDVILVSQGSDSDALGVVDRYRIPGLIGLVGVFMVLVLIVGRRRGLASLIGLVVSIIVIAWFMIPMILAGNNALWISIIGAYMIAFSSIIIAHGWYTRTLISLSCIITLLTFIAVGSYLVVHLLGFTGLNDETAFYLANSKPDLDLQGVLVGGIIIASLGVLDDIVTAQVATVEEIFKANRKLGVRELFGRASSVGGEHIASLVNTLALVYVGAALPTIILLATYNNGNPTLLINGEFFATEVIRTIIASIGLVLAVPFSTFIGAVVFHKLFEPTK